MPTFTPAFEFPILMEFGTTFANRGNKTFSPAFEFPILLDYGTTFANRGNKTFSPAFEFPILFSGGASFFASAKKKSFSKAFEVSLFTNAKKPGDTAVEILLGAPVISSFPGNMQMTEILYPVIPLNAVNKVLSKMDSQEFRVTQKSAAQFTRKVSTIRFSVDTSYMPTFLGDLYSNRLVQFRLTTLGYTPFGINSSDNWVRILNHTEPQREIGGLSYLVDITFLFMATYP